MKILVRIGLLIMFILIQFQEGKASDLIFRRHDRSLFTIVFNRTLPVYGCSYFQQTNLGPGNYTIEVYDQCLTPGNPCAFPLYQGVLSIPANVQVMAFLDAGNRLQTGGLIPLHGIIQGNPASVAGNSYRNNFFRNPWTNLNDSSGYEQGKKIMKELSNVKLQLNYLKRSIYFYGISARKLAEIMKLFPFDTERLDLATYGYPFTTDRENYQLVYDALIFSGSRSQLDNHLYYWSSMIHW